ncbi:N-alpha-acetyltransferase 60-like [Clytia hemisphaerica]|uniref:N-alpha-acetyltransferase 60 n=1 Tax=Clytia hemisphaerica TaxID=252671 RepID=A0A7M5V1S3_9CNID|eukprot:TCONS_00063358-protein
MSSLEEIKQSTFIDEIELRFLNNNDIADLKRLCKEWFPLRYPDVWYQQVTNNPRFFSLAATYNGETVGVLIAEIRDRNQCNKEDSDMLSYWYPWYPSDTKVAYILIVGAAKEYRRKGVASHLLEAFLLKVQSPENYNCKCVYLHVLASNLDALLFYERQHFKRHKHLPLYYTINNVKMDGYCYVLYVNDGQPPFSLVEFVEETVDYLAVLSVCRFSRYMFRQLWSLPRKFIVHRAANTTKMVSTL